MNSILRARRRYTRNFYEADVARTKPKHLHTLRNSSSHGSFQVRSTFGPGNRLQDFRLISRSKRPKSWKGNVAPRTRRRSATKGEPSAIQLRHEILETNERGASSGGALRDTRNTGRGSVVGSRICMTRANIRRVPRSGKHVTRSRALDGLKRFSCYGDSRNQRRAHLYWQLCRDITRSTLSSDGIQNQFGRIQIQTRN